jgi:hypothetical protein
MIAVAVVSTCGTGWAVNVTLLLGNMSLMLRCLVGEAGMDAVSMLAMSSELRKDYIM